MKIDCGLWSVSVVECIMGWETEEEGKYGKNEVQNFS